MFEIRGISGEDVYAIAFDNSAVAASFLRDFHVRLRVMQLSWKTVKGQHEAQGAKNQLEEYKQQSFSARFGRFLWSLVLVLVVVALLRIAVLVFEGRQYSAALRILMADAQ